MFFMSFRALRGSNKGKYCPFFSVKGGIVQVTVDIFVSELGRGLPGDIFWLPMLLDFLITTVI